MRTAIVVFAKTLGLTPVKTRLAAHIGQEQANAFYELSVKAIQSTLDTVCNQYSEVDVHWALAEAEGPQQPCWRQCKAMWTGEGDLGERLNRVTEVLFASYDAVVMIGTDSPQLQAAHFDEAIGLLKSQSKHAVAGPCTDGGFYLFGTREALGDQVWHTVRYSQSDTLSQLIQRIEHFGFTWSCLEQLSDVDVAADLKTMKNALASIEAPSRAQCELLEWFKQID